jgi:hypothetical protein
MMKFTLIAASIETEPWRHIKADVQRLLNENSKGHVQIAPGLWVFSNSECYSGVVDLLHCLKSHSDVAFVMLPFDSPIAVGLSSAGTHPVDGSNTVLKLLAAAEVEVWKLGPK